MGIKINHDPSRRFILDMVMFETTRHGSNEDTLAINSIMAMSSTMY